MRTSLLSYLLLPPTQPPAKMGRNGVLGQLSGIDAFAKVRGNGQGLCDEALTAMALVTLPFPADRRWMMCAFEPTLGQ